MNRLLAASAVFLSLGLAPLATHAAVSFSSYGVATPPGETLITDFSTAAGLSGGGNLVAGSVSGQYAAPAFSPTTSDTSQYLEVPGGQSETLTLAHPAQELSIYVGSLDSYNTLAFGGAGAVTYTGAQLGVASGAADGNQTADNTNGRFTFTFSAPVDSITFSSGANAFEVADVAGVAGVPEPATWALMLIGAGLLGGVARGSRGRAIA